MYHEVVPQKLSKFSVNSQQFEAQLKTLVDSGINSYILDHTTFNADNMNDQRYCMLTFDDGHVSNLQAARKLAERGLTAYFYLIKDFSLQKEDYLDENSIKEIAAMGHHLGIHGKNHDHWTKMEGKKLINDLRETKAWVEQLIGKPVITCSAPGGAINLSVINRIKHEIPELKYIRTSHYGVNNDSDTVLNSIGVKWNYSVEKVLRLAQNDFWEMRKTMMYYHTKELLKPLYHKLKGR